MYKELSNISYIFENCIKLKELSIIGIDFIDDKEPEPEDFFDFINQDFDSIDIYKDNSLYLKKSFSIISSINYDYNIEETAMPFKKYNENLCETDKFYLEENIIHLKKKYNYFSNMSRMFYNCLSLLSLPDISSWNTDYVIDMSRIFENCSSLSSLPDISEWTLKMLKI